LNHLSLLSIRSNNQPVSEKKTFTEKRKLDFS
jgi:hypothetical protein